MIIKGIGKDLECFLSRCDFFHKIVKLCGLLLQQALIRLRLGDLALIAILLLVSVFIISNTIKLTTFDRRDEIAIMKMVGATNGFIRWPFVYEGFMLGLTGAVLAFLLQWGLYEAIAKGVANNDTLQLLSIVPFRQLWKPVGGVFLGAGILIGVGGSLSAIRRFLQV